MRTCQNCHNELPAGDLRIATCPVCGRIADPSDSVELARTDEFAVAPVSATRAAGQGSASHWSELDAGRTFECAELPIEVSRTMNAVWLASIDEHTAPNVTVKGAEVEMPAVSLGRTLESLRIPSVDIALPGGADTLADPPPWAQGNGNGNGSGNGHGSATGDRTLDDGALIPLRGSMTRDRTRAEFEPSSDDPGTIHSPSDETISELVIKQRNFSLAAEDSGPSPDAEYELIQLLGEGGMGVVYAARQRSINRAVAVKMLKRRGVGQVEQDLARQKFLAEAVVTGDLDHPNIVPIYDVGRNEHDALFYSMKRVHGTPWLEVLPAKSLHENLEILMKVADAVAFAHSRGVVHRDLKPENVMLGEFGEVQLMDWGLALPTARFDKAKRFLKTRGMGGTPAYMAPEMATGPLERIGPHSDIYLLGAILFEIVTGRRPHEGANARECLIAAARNAIVPTRKSGELLDIALRAMSMKPRDRHATVQEFQAAIRGYLSHTESVTLSSQAEDDLKRAEHSNDYQDFSQALFAFKEAIKLWDGNTRARDGLNAARLRYAECAYNKGDYELGAGLLDLNSPSHATLHRQIQEAIAERDARQTRLNAARRIGRCLLALVLAVVTCAAVWINAERQEAERQREQAVLAQEDAERQKEEAKRQARIAEQQRQLALDREREADLARQSAVAEREKADEQRQLAENARVQAEREKAAANRAREEEVEQRRFAQAEAERATREQRRALAAQEAADAARRAEAYEGYIARIGLAAAKIRENAFGTAEDLLKQCRPQGPEDRDLRNWEWGRLMHLCRQFVKSVPAAGPVYALAVAPDGNRFVAVGAGGFARVFDRETQLPVAELQVGPHDVFAAAFSPDGRFIATGSADPQAYVRLWDAATGEAVRTFGPARRADRAASGSGAGSGGESGSRFAVEHTGPVMSVAFSGDGLRLLTGSQDETARLWDLGTGEQIQRFWGHSGWVWSAALCPNTDAAGRALPERRVVTASQDGTARIWIDRSARNEPAWTVFDGDSTFREHDGPVFAAAFSPDGRLVATAGHDRRILLWDPERIEPDQIRERVLGEAVEETRHRTLEGHTAPVRTLAFLDGEHLVTGSDDNTVKLWNVVTGTAYKTFREDWSNTFRGHDSGVRAVAFRQSSASSSFPGSAWERPAAQAPPGAQDGIHWILSAGLDSTIKEWRIAEYEEIRELEGRVFAGRHGHAAAVLAAEFSADGRGIVTASQDRTAKTWNAERAQLERTFREGHELLASSVVFFRDGRRIVTAAVDNTTRVWDAATGTELLKLDRTGRNAAVAVSRDGRWILTGSDRRVQPTRGGGGDDASENGWWAARLWDANTGRLIRELAGHRHDVTAVAFSHDGRLAASGDASGRVSLWETATGNRLRDLEGHARGGHVTGIAFTPEGRTVLTASTDQTVATWDVTTGQELGDRRLVHPDGAGIVSMALSPDGTQVLTSADDGIVRLWDAATARVIRTLDTGAGLVNAVDIAADGRRALTVNAMSLDENPDAAAQPGANDLTVRLWDLTTGREILYPTPGAVGGGVDGRGVAETVLRADSPRPRVPVPPRPATSFLDFKLPSLTGLVWSAAFSPDGEHVVTVGGSTARLWTTQLERGHRGADGRQLVSVLDPRDREIMRFSPQGELAAAAFSPDGDWIVTGSWDGSARVWDRATGRAIVKLAGPEGHRGRINSAMFAPGGDKRGRSLRVLTAGDDGTVRVWRLVKGGRGSESPVASVERVFGADAESAPPVHQAIVSPDGEWVLAVMGDGTARIWELVHGRLIVEFQAHTAPALCTAFSADGLRILVGSEDSTASLWELTNIDGVWSSRRALTLKGHTARITSVAFSPAEDQNGNGRIDDDERRSLRALTASADTTVKLWDTRVVESRISDEAATPALAEVVHVEQRRAGDGDHAEAEVAGETAPSQDSSAGFAKEILTLSGHSEEVTTVRFSPDGRRVLTAGRDGRAILWLTADWR